jgi:lysophospholipase L1-like esterase
LALGDSFTFGLGVGDSETWPAVLEAELRRQLTDDVRVLNLGTISYGVFHELDLLLGKGLVQRPDIVVHALYWNDYMSAAPPAADDPTVLTEEGYFVWDRSRASATRPYLIDMMGRSAVLSALKEAVDRAFPRADQSMTGYGRAYRDLLTSGLTRAQWDLISNFYRQLKALGAQEGFVPFAVVLPVVDIVAGHSPSSHPYAIQVRRMLQDTEVPYLDALSLWAERGLGGETFLPQGPDAHLNANGYSVLADAIAHALLSEPATASKLH